MGRVAAPFRVKGWIKVTPFTESPDGLCRFHRWWVGRGDARREYEVLESAVHGASVVARLAGCDVREAAARLKGAEVAVERALFPAAGENEYYWADLVGLVVENLRGEPLGEVSELFSNGAHDIMRVRQVGRERLIPFVTGVVERVDLAARRMVVDWGSDW